MNRSVLTSYIAARSGPLKALRARQDGSPPSVSIGSAGHVNVAQAQVNANSSTQADEAADEQAQGS